MKKFLILLCLVPFFLLARETSLIYLRSSDAVELDPALQWDFFSSEVLYNVLEGLVKTTDGYTVVPWLAERWRVSKDGKVWTFYLRRGVYFHDGTQLTAMDVYRSFRRMMGNSRALAWKPLLGVVREVRVRGSYVLDLILERKYAPLLAALANPVASIISSSSLRGGKFIPVGTGPFVFKQWKKGDYILLEANPRYWRGKPPVDRLVIKAVADGKWRVLQLKNGDADVAEITAISELEEVKLAPNLYYKLIPILNLNYMVFNTSRSPFDRREVRLAFAHLINKKLLVRYVLSSIGQPAVTPVPPALPGYNPDIEDYPFSLEKAKELLERAGYGDGFSCQLLLAEGRPHQRAIVLALMRNARKVGVRIEIQELPFGKLLEKLKRGEYEVAVLAWNADVPDADNFLYPFFHSRGGHNFSFFSSPVMDRILERARTCYDARRRLSLYRRAQEIVHEQVPIIPLFHKKCIVAFRRGIVDLRFSPKGYIDFSSARRLGK